MWSLLKREQKLLMNPQPGISPQELDHFRAYWPYPLPDEVAHWFQHSQSGNIGWSSYGIATLDHGQYEPYTVFKNGKWREQGWLVVGGDGNGDYYIVLTKPGPQRGIVVFVDQDDIDRSKSMDYAVATSMTQWLRFDCNREARGLALGTEADGNRRWPFNLTFARAQDKAWNQLIPKALEPGRDEHR